MYNDSEWVQERIKGRAADLVPIPPHADGRLSRGKLLGKVATYHKRNEVMKNAVLYVHGKGGSAVECEHYKPLFPEYDVFGLDYQTFTPWETGAEIRSAVKKLKTEYAQVLYLMYFEDFSTQEIANIMSKNKKQIGNLVFRDKKALKNELETEGFEYEEF